MKLTAESLHGPYVVTITTDHEKITMRQLRDIASRHEIYDAWENDWADAPAIENVRVTDRYVTVRNGLDVGEVERILQEHGPASGVCYVNQIITADNPSDLEPSQIGMLTPYTVYDRIACDDVDTYDGCSAHNITLCPCED